MNWHFSFHLLEWKVYLSWCLDVFSFKKPRFKLKISFDFQDLCEMSLKVYVMMLLWREIKKVEVSGWVLCWSPRPVADCSVDGFPKTYYSLSLFKYMGLNNGRGFVGLLKIYWIIFCAKSSNYEKSMPEFRVNSRNNCYFMVQWGVKTVLTQHTAMYFGHIPHTSKFGLPMCQYSICGLAWQDNSYSRYIILKQDIQFQMISPRYGWYIMLL